MPVKLYSAENFEPGSTPSQFLVSGKSRDYYTSKNGIGFTGTDINPAGIIAEPGNGYRYHVYLSPTTIQVVGKPLEVDYLVVGGGGGSGGRFPAPSPSVSGGGTGGGGGGGMRSGTIELTTGSYPITVGSGGSRGVGPSVTQIRGSSGSPSFAFSITSTGGGGGGGFYWTPNPGLGPPSTLCAGRPGGSGGGGGSSFPGTVPAYPTGFLGGSGNTPPTTPPQGNPGGGSPGLVGSGGGGAGGSGSAFGLAGIGRTDIRFAAPLIAPAIPAPLRPTWIDEVGDLGTYAKGGIGGGSGAPADGSPGHSYTGNGANAVAPIPSPITGLPGGTGGPGIFVFRYLI
jgi:hypothetical protein